MQQNQQILITSQESVVVPFPGVNTCALTMYFAPRACSYGNDSDNYSEVNFIKCLRTILAQPEYGYQVK
jgi:hypothetical protein